MPHLRALCFPGTFIPIGPGQASPAASTAASVKTISKAKTPPIFDVDSYQRCWDIARRAHSNFIYAFYLLPKHKRDGMAALYAFMRLVDDVADEGDDLNAKQRGLAKWRAALDQAVTGTERTTDGSAALAPQNVDGAAEVLPALVDTMRRFNMPTRYLHDLISGAEMDLTVKTYLTFDRLKEYCYRLPGTVGLTCTHVFAFSDPRAR